MRKPLIEPAQWESECYHCGVKFRNCKTRFYTSPSRKQVLINIKQKPAIKTFCSEECKFDYIFSLMRERERIGEVKGYRSLRL